MDKRTFLKVSAWASAGLMVSPLAACTSPAGEQDQTGPTFTLPELGYSFAALEPHIDARTMELHHGKHHAGYVAKLNAALPDSAFAGLDLPQIMAQVGETDTAIRNNGGGHYNHSLFWRVIGPQGGGEPTGPLADALTSAFGSFATFQEQFAQAAGSVFGSGWAWLCVDDSRQLFITTTPNQDNPLMQRLVETSGTPILGLDVWEHAYYLQYQNRRSEYVSNFFDLINWTTVAANLQALG